MSKIAFDEENPFDYACSDNRQQGGKNMGLADKRLSNEEQELLISLLMKQEYAIELLSSELNDIENGEKAVDMETYKQLTVLYDRIRFE